MNGLEALAKLRAIEKIRHTPVIALTAAAMPEDIKKGNSAGFDDYLTKPINILEVLEIVGGYLKDGIETR